MPEMSTTITIKPGEKVFVRTVTHYYVGEVVGVDERWLALTKTAWVADTGRWSEALASGTLNEVEPYPDADVVLVSLGAVVDIAPWHGALPLGVK